MRCFAWAWTLSSHILELSFRLLCKHNKHAPHSRTRPGTEACPMEMQITGLIPVNRLWNGEFHHVSLWKNCQNIITVETSKQTKDTLKHWNFKSSRNLVRYCCWTSAPLDLQSCRRQRPSGTALTSQGPPSQDRSIHSPNPRSRPSWQSYSGTRWNLGKRRADLDTGRSHTSNPKKHQKANCKDWTAACCSIPKITIPPRSRNLPKAWSKTVTNWRAATLATLVPNMLRHPTLMLSYQIYITLVYVFSLFWSFWIIVVCMSFACSMPSMPQADPKLVYKFRQTWDLFPGSYFKCRGGCSHIFPACCGGGSWRMSSRVSL